MRFSNIDAALDVCRKHQAEALAAGLDSFRLKEIEHYLLRATVLLIISQYEEYIEKMFCKRAEKTHDPEIHALISKLMNRKFRSPDLNKITDTLACLGDSCRTAFNFQVETQQPQIHAAWTSLMTARHAIVHKANSGTVALTWTDLEQAYQDSNRVLQALANALGLTARDVNRL